MLYYTSIFKNSKIGTITCYGDEGPGPVGTLMTARIQIEGMEFTLLNGGPHFSFTPAVSFFMRCESQDEVDELWEKLSEGGEPGQCGWLTDKCGLSGRSYRR